MFQLFIGRFCDALCYLDSEARAAVAGQGVKGVVIFIITTDDNYTEPVASDLRERNFCSLLMIY